MEHLYNYIGSLCYLFMEEEKWHITNGFDVIGSFGNPIIKYWECSGYGYLWDKNFVWSSKRFLTKDEFDAKFFDKREITII